ncbi:MAG: hypothetical protein J7502_06610 [Flavisolibacter sp.]|nr:hypothetical protein [Flavisolibacter sp.]
MRKLASAGSRTIATKKTKRLRHKYNSNTQGLLLFRFLLVFYLPSLGDAHKNFSYAKA